MRRERTMPLGFTLPELLVVIGIIGILASLLLAALHHVRITAMEGATRTFAHTIEVACASYAADEGYLPGASLDDPDAPPVDDPETLFRCLMGSRTGAGGRNAPHISADLDGIADMAGRTIDDLNPTVGDPAGTPGGFLIALAARGLGAPTPAEIDGGHFVFIDPWGRPLHYAEYESRSDDARIRPRTGGGGNPRTFGGFEIWSNGADGIPGTADDLVGR